MTVLSRLAFEDAFLAAIAAEVDESGDEEAAAMLCRRCREDRLHAHALLVLCRRAVAEHHSQRETEDERC